MIDKIIVEIRYYNDRKLIRKSGGAVMADEQFKLKQCLYALYEMAENELDELS